MVEREKHNYPQLAIYSAKLKVSHATLSHLKNDSYLQDLVIKVIYIYIGPL